MSALGMPPHLLVLFQARPPLEHVDPLPSKPIRKIDGLYDYLNSFSSDPPPERVPFETPRERRDKRKRERLLKYKEELKEKADKYDPRYDPRISRGGTSSWLTHDPYKTLFVANISYEVTERQLCKEFEVFGKIRRVRMIHDRNNKPRGYAFIEFESEREMVTAYKRGDGKKIAGRRVIVDVERARTVEGWLPRRLGGGKGRSRGHPPKFYDGKPLIPEKEKKEDPSS